MSDGNKLSQIIVSIVTLFGPISYLLYALYEGGRLRHFGAPVEFIQLTSFGILPVVETIHPGIILTAVVMTLLGGMKHATPIHQIRMACGVIGYVAGTVAVIATNEKIKWGFGIVAALCAAVAIVVSAGAPDLGNEQEKPAPIPKSGAEKYENSVRNWVFIVSAVFFFSMGYVAAGIKKAENQTEYWVSGDRVALAIYGNTVLLAELHGQEVGPGFELVETKTLPKPLVLKGLGPIRPAIIIDGAKPKPTQ